MKSQVIPAQITTVEDKIAGNLNLTQLLLLIAPCFFTAIVYAIFPPQLGFSIYKVLLVMLSIIICSTLAIRVKGKVLLNWLFILLSYNMRPKYYLFNKNDIYLRDMELPTIEKKPRKLFKKVAKQKVKGIIPNISVNDLVRLENLIKDPKYSFTLKTAKKGGLYVALEQERK